MLTSSRSRSDVHRKAMFMSDGHSNINRQHTIPEAIQLKQTGCVVIVFAIGTNIDYNELYGIASDPVSHSVFVVGSYSQLPNILNELRQATTDGQWRHVNISKVILSV